MSGSHRHRLTTFSAASLVALLALAPATAAAAAAHPAAPAVPTICHGLTQPNDPYHLGCRAGYLEGSSAGNKAGKPPICQKVAPPLSPVNPTPYEQGKREGYVYGYNQSFATAYKANCANKPQVPPPPQKPPPQTQTPSSMAAAGQAAGTTWGKEDARLTCTRAHANLVPPKTPDTLITAYQNGYRVGYDTAYDEAYRQMCMNK
ncbi:hypothetical protein [Streptomyces sp. NPDC059564]|uniref:hypothetical protein n=1 Tax=Streptomyces sp. NPDC059564 TaxID=3346865 RepID=UPI0036CB9B91